MSGEAMKEVPVETGGRKAIEKIVERAVLRAANRIVGIKNIHQRSEIAGEEIDKAVEAILALRAQPQACEDAQPVAWRYKLDDETAQALFRPGWNFQEHKPPVQWGPYGRLITEAEPLYTHPAPDALRVALEALEPFAKGGHHRTMPGLSPSYTVADFGDGVVVTVADFRRAAEALAVMQAEQKGGA